MDDSTPKPIQPSSQTSSRLAIATGVILFFLFPVYFIIPEDSPSVLLRVGRALLAPAAFIVADAVVELLFGLAGFALNKAWKTVLRVGAIISGVVLFVVLVT